MLALCGFYPMPGSGLPTSRSCWPRPPILSFNRITVDGDTSTNDACVLLASGVASAKPPLTPGYRGAHDRFASAVFEVCAELARAIVRDGEGLQNSCASGWNGPRTMKKPAGSS
jgi:N-acetylglutamate synthase/N-acetylornithine aminotransferase